MVRTEYKKRAKRDKKFQKKVFKMVIDWTIALYFVIPIFIALGVIHYQLWQSPPSWITLIPVEWLGSILFLATTLFSMRTYVEKADELFVIQKMDYFQSLIQIGKYDSILKTVFETSIIILYLLPIFMVGYGLSFLFVFIIYVYVFLWSLFQKLTSRWFSLRRIVWRKRIFTFIGFALYSIGYHSLFYVPLIFSCITLLVLIPILFLFKKEREPLKYFYAEAERERNEKWKWASLILRQSGELEGMQKIRKFPLLNKNSRPIFKERTQEKVLAEMYWKWHVRKGSQLKFYLYFIGVSFYAMVILPVKIKLIVLLFIIFAGYKIQEGLWKSFITHPFTRNIGYNNQMSMTKAKRIALLVMWLLPFGALAIVTVGLNLLD